MSEEKYISLTFDDGPVIGITDEILDILEKEDIKASFFIVSDWIKPEAEYLIKRAYDMGCTIENHSRTHSDMTKLSENEIREEIEHTDREIIRIVGEKPQFFRPPYIAIDKKMYDAIEYPFICGCGCEDWVPTVPAEDRIGRILADAHDGEIVLLHDMHHNENTVEAVRAIVPILKEQGYEFVNIRDLFKHFGVTPERGKTYSGVYDIRPDDF
ncbi:MAG: polysaccharide deacetylase family protein [Lachnospiraceae bacterium]|nr:polysaccharide deacetylase family protein [Lachnospiraceae bacterium]